MNLIIYGNPIKSDNTNIFRCYTNYNLMNESSLDNKAQRQLLTTGESSKNKQKLKLKISHNEKTTFKTDCNAILPKHYRKMSI